MKRGIAIVLLVVFVFSLWGCGQTEQVSDPIVEACKNAAQQHIDNGDVESAIVVLEEGIALTNDPSLQAILDQLKATEVTEPSQNQGTADAFLGSWIGTDCRMEITQVSDILILHMECLSYRVVEYDLKLTAEVSSVEGNKLVFPFADDGRGNQGSVVLYSDKDTLNYVISDYVTVSDYGIRDGYGGGSLERSESNLEEENLEGQMVRAFDDVVGTYMDTGGAYLPMEIYYEGEDAYAEFALVGSLGILTVKLYSDRVGNNFSGVYMDGYSSEPTAIVGFLITNNGSILADIEYWTDDGLYEDTILYAPADWSQYGLEHLVHSAG